MIELKKMIRKLSSTNKFSYPSFENLFKLIADHAFNTNAQISDKLKMLFIHIRNACKMHYQVSFSFDMKRENLKTPMSSEDSASEPIDQDFKSLNTSKEILVNEKHRYSTRFLAGIKRFASISPQRNLSKSPNVSSILKNESKLNTRGITISPVPVLDFSEKSTPMNQNKSPLATTFSTTIIRTGKTPSVTIKNDKSSGAMAKANSYLKIRAHLRALSSGIIEKPKSRSISPQKPENKYQKIIEIYDKFKGNHEKIAKEKPKTKEKLNEKQIVYIQQIRNQYFSPIFVKAVIFNVWKGSLSRFKNNKDV